MSAAWICGFAEEASFALFRALGVSLAGSPEAMQDHLKLIPRQVIQIVTENPTVLGSSEAFKVALSRSARSRPS